MTPRSLLALVLAAGTVVGCSDDPVCDSCEATTATGASSTGAGGAGGTGGTACTSTKGTLAGTVYRWGPPADPLSELAPNAFVLLRENPDVPPTYAMADPDARYEVEIEAGDWLVGAEDGEGCYSDAASPVVVEACETTAFDVVMDVCTG